MEIRTGIGSKMVKGFHCVSSCTSDIIAAALVGEQMKCSVEGRQSFVFTKSRGVILILGVRYANLRDQATRASEYCYTGTK